MKSWGRRQGSHARHIFTEDRTRSSHSSRDRSAKPKFLTTPNITSTRCIGDQTLNSSRRSHGRKLVSKKTTSTTGRATSNDLNLTTRRRAGRVKPTLLALSGNNSSSDSSTKTWPGTIVRPETMKSKSSARPAASATLGIKEGTPKIYAMMDTLPVLTGAIGRMSTKEASLTGRT
jgi:hypothetical protein